MSIVADAGNTVMVSSDMTDAIEDMEGKVVYMRLKPITFHLNPLRIRQEILGNHTGIFFQNKF